MPKNNKIEASRLGIIISVILTPIVIYLVGICLPKLPSSKMLQDAFWANKISSSKKYDIVFVGDSRIYRGINPLIVSKITFSNTVNFGFSAAGLDSTLIYSASQLLSVDGKKTMIFGITPSAFTLEASKNEHFKSLKKISKKDLWIRKHLYPELGFFNSYSLSEIKKAMNHEAYFQDCQSDGFIYSNKIPFDSTSALDAYTSYFKHTSISQLQISKFLNIIKQLQLNGIKCFAFRVPVSLPMNTLESQIFDFETFKIQLELAGAHWMDIPQKGFNSYDGSHLTGPSANKLSRILGDSILNYH
ncbi:MAG: hypothetical protein PSX81_15505 [bacterium]|nr:hypothetical protein [bacterium]